MKILITTGIYPPDIGGPAQYAKELNDAFKRAGHTVMVKTYRTEKKLPSGIRHIFFFLKIIPAVLRADTIIILDTLSVGLPTVFAGKIFRRQTIIRTGGDFLWEQYVERTKKKVLFKDFYGTEMNNFSKKERVIFFLTRWTLQHTTKVIFSTEWQRDIFVRAYALDGTKAHIVENFYGSKEVYTKTVQKPIIFVASTRALVWKNHFILEKTFGKVKKTHPEIVLFTDNLPYGPFMEKIKSAYAVILVSLGDISPNMILDAIRLNTPFICTREVGIYDRIKSCGIYVEPLDENAIMNAIERLLNSQMYDEEIKKLRAFTFTHTWDDIAKEFIVIAQKQ